MTALFSAFTPYIKLMRLDKPIGILLLLWPTAWALWVAGQGAPSPKLCMIFGLGVILTRTAGVLINDWADRHIDGHVTRTAQRPLATGIIHPTTALLLAGVVGLMAASLLLFLNPLTRMLALIAAALAILYPFCKRWIHAPQAVLGLAFGWAVPMAFAAQTGTIPPIGWYMLGIATLWPVIYDTFYAMADAPDDARLGVKSTALWLGRLDRPVTAILQCVFFVLLVYLGHWLTLNVFYSVSVIISGLLMLSMQWLIRHRQPPACFFAFKLNHWIGLVVFLGLVLGGL